MDQPKICIIVPAYNEEASIEKVIKSLNAHDDTLIIAVINDASKDKTKEVAEATGLANVITLPCNLGIGGGVQTGFLFAKRLNCDIAIQFDGDGQHVAEEIPKLTAPILKNEADVVIGSRFVGNNETTFKSTAMRRIGIRFFQWLNSILIKQKITDNTSGFRAYNKQALDLLSEQYPVDYPEPEAVILLGRNGFKIKEVFTRMEERDGGESSIGGLKSAYYMVKVTLSILITAIRPTIKR
ncbi:glycosyltransferase family 2 protein [Marinagarivorans cellulosilyticus]|uniref:Glycosyltransferase n=1 Tax=Marinagarivorans cellulosilyticus TaxID=2721545 RepID=A0AAN1WGF3_9GAMM|nr:glycosyltransferase family 2 protein [Marinagarivorans cellulosilyticus]BCD97070.1 glycosyltransferase [Marinagarivorans cellulosilyticus]